MRQWTRILQQSLATGARRFQQLTRRQQTTTLIIAAIIALALIYGAALKPAWDFSQRARASLDKERTLLDTLHQHADDIRRLNAARQAKTGQDTSLLALASQTALEHELLLQRYEPSADGKLALWLTDADFNNVLPWLEQLVNQYHVQIERASIGSSTQTGSVDVQLQLRQ